ncbi:MAG: hydrolase family protein [Clostridia bacterium]|nr:hydrolase family protein [Clostridia bacterium]
MIREFYEWVNFWWENAPNIEADRILVIGDSITNGYRSILQKNLNENNILVDMTVGSRSVEDPALEAEFKYVMGTANNFKYKLIQFNNGLHGAHLSVNEYEAGIRKHVQIIKELQPQAVILLATSTPYTPKNSEGTINLIKNKQVIERNEILKKLSSELCLPLNDLFYSIAGKSEYPQPDEVHFTSAGYEYLAKITADIIKSVLKSNNYI